jgi:hypothetical protein
MILYDPTHDEEGVLDALAAELGRSKIETLESVVRSLTTLEFELRSLAEQEKIAPARQTLTSEEQGKIERLYAELTPEYWQRRHLLEDRQRAGEIGADEHTELLRLIEEGEAWNVRRLRFFFELARKYNRPSDYYLDTLNLRHHPLSERP